MAEKILENFIMYSSGVPFNRKNNLVVYRLRKTKNNQRLKMEKHKVDSNIQNIKNNVTRCPGSSKHSLELTGNGDRKKNYLYEN